jgi:hypothetical protein
MDVPGIRLASPRRTGCYVTGRFGQLSPVSYTGSLTSIKLSRNYISEIVFKEIRNREPSNALQ